MMKTGIKNRVGVKISQPEIKNPHSGEIVSTRQKTDIAGKLSQPEIKNRVGETSVFRDKNTLSKERDVYVFRDRHIHSFIESNAKSRRGSSGRRRADEVPQTLTFEIFQGRNPPTVTAQEKKVAVGKNGKPRYYDPDELKKARAAICAELEKHKPDAPLEGPVRLFVGWSWKHSDGREGWRDTKPDTDNLQKLFKDCMTRMRFWIDDAQVCLEVIGKRWGKPGVTVIAEEM